MLKNTQRESSLKAQNGSSSSRQIGDDFHGCPTIVLAHFPQQTLLSSWKQLHRLSLSTGEIIGFLYRKVLPRYQIKQLFCRRYHLFVGYLLKGFYQFRVQSRFASRFLLSSFHHIPSLYQSCSLLQPFQELHQDGYDPASRVFNCGFLGHLI